DAVHIVVRHPHRIVMAVPDRVVWMPHPRERPARRAIDRKQKWPAQRVAEMIASQLDTALLKRCLVVRLRYDLHGGYRQRIVGTRRNAGRRNEAYRRENVARAPHRAAFGCRACRRAAIWVLSGSLARRWAI